MYVSWCMTCCMKKNCGFTFLIFLRFAENLTSVRSNLGEKFDQQLEQIITEFTGVTEKPQGLPPHRGRLDHKVKWTGYSQRQQRQLIYTID